MQRKTSPIVNMRGFLSPILVPLFITATAKGAPTKPVKSIYTVLVNGKSWYGGIFLMCPINRLVVHHTWSLFMRSQDQHPERVYSDNFGYNEIVARPRYYQAVLHVLGLSVLVAGLLFSPVRFPHFQCLCVLSDIFEDMVDPQVFLATTQYQTLSV